MSRVIVAVMLVAGTSVVSSGQAPPQAPRQRPLEQIAYDAATAISDPEKSAAALKALLDNPQFKAHGIARQAQNTLFNLLVTKLPDRTADINAVLDAMIAGLDGTAAALPAGAAPRGANAAANAAPPANASLTDALAALDKAAAAVRAASGAPAVPVSAPASPQAPATPMARLNSITTWATSLVDANILLDRAAAIIAPPLAALTFDDYAASTRASLERAKATNPNVSVPTDAQLKSTFDANRGRGLEVLGRIHLAQGNLDLAEREFTDAIAGNPSLYTSELGLAQIGVKRGNEKAALDHYLVAALSGHLKRKDDDAMMALYKKVHGSTAGLDDELDKIYRAKFPNPVTPTPYSPVPNRSTRVVLAEMFTGSGCPPCVAADLAMDALAEHYAAKDVIFLAYHANIPQPDPMVVAGGDTRRTYYKVPGVPTMHVDGVGKVGGGGRDSAAALYADYLKMIDKELAAPATADVGVTATRTGSIVKVNVNVTKLAADAKDPRLHIVLAERELRFSGENGVRFHNVVVRAVAGEKAQDGSGFALTSGAPKALEHVFDLKAIPGDLTKTLADEMIKRRKGEATAGRAPGDYRAEGHAMTAIDPNALFVVVYVQDADKKVLQATKVDLAPANAATTRK